MNLRVKLAALLAEGKTLVEKCNAGDEAALKRAAELADEIEQAKAAIEQAEAFEKKIGAIGAIGKKKEDEGDQPKTLGAFAAKAVEAAGMKQGWRGERALGTFVKAEGSPMVSPSGVSGALAEVQERLYEGPRRRLVVADLFGQETTSRAAVTYFVESETVNGAVTTVAEGAQKPLISFGDPDPVTENVRKIAAVMKESDEMLEDLPWLASAIDNRGIYMVQLFEEDALLNGDGTGTNLTGLLNRAGLLAEEIGEGESNFADALFRAKTAVGLNSPFEADGIVINPADYQTLRLAKDSNSQYYGGGYFAGPYGNGAVMEQPPIWGLRTVVTPAVAQGTAIVGAFAQGGSVIRRQGLTVDIANQNEDDWRCNRIAIRIEERLALAIRYPKAFCEVTLTPEV